MIKLSKRLQMVADMVTQGNIVADVGCDHAHTSIYLCQKGISPHAYASDIRPGAVEHAVQNVNRAKLAYKIDVTLADGLSALKPGEIDTVLLSGMGGPLMVDILSAELQVTLSAKELVLSPQSDPGVVRQFVLSHGFEIVAEELCRDAGKFYVVLKCEKAFDKQNSVAVAFLEQPGVNNGASDLLSQYSDFELDYGKFLFNDPTAEVLEFVENQIGKYERIQAQHPTEENAKKIVKLKEIAGLSLKSQ